MLYKLSYSIIIIFEPLKVNDLYRYFFRKPDTALNFYEFVGNILGIQIYTIRGSSENLATCDFAVPNCELDFPRSFCAKSADRKIITPFAGTCG